MFDYLVIIIGKTAADVDTIQRLDFDDIIEKIENNEWNINDIRKKFPEHTAFESWDSGIYIINDSFDVVVPKPSGWEIDKCE